MAVAEIAHQRLSPEARAEADRLIAMLADHEPRFDDFVTASVWLDAVRSAGWRSFDRWHYIDLPVNADGLAELPRPSDDNAVDAVRQAVRVLSDPTAPNLARAFMLRTLIHVVADLHQPLHCVSRYAIEAPDGDRGGNDFTLPEEDGGTLHRLWDSTFGLLPNLDPDAEARVRMPALVAELERSVVEDLLVGREVLDPEEWAREGFRLAASSVYVGVTPGRPVPEAYRVKGRFVVRRRLLIAGLRLADLLEQTLASSPGEPGGTIPSQE